MDKKQAQDLIKETFENSFNSEQFTIFIKNLLKRIEEEKFVYQGNYIPEAFEPYISKLERIGKYNDGKNEIDVLIVNLKKETSLERARTMQRNFIAKYLNGSRGGKLKDAALVAFVSPDSSDWRFSLVKMDYRFEETPSGKVKVKEEFTPARRWSFLVGPNEKSHTAQSRFLPILEDDSLKPTLQDLEEAFNVEKVTKEFFEKFRDLYIKTKKELDKIIKGNLDLKKEFEEKNITTVDFSKKLLGQIVFLYFLQKKGWFGVQKGEDWGTGPKNFMRKLFNKEYGDYKNFFNDILEPLFYEALRTDRSTDDHYYSRFNCKIPFLNGGLFDPINNYDWVNKDISLPNDLFSNQNRTKEGDTGDGIFDVFDRFNFTVNEEEPLEKEVALDPELLGKIYEKLNAIREDNFDEYEKILLSGNKGEETKFNKEYGVYYTPREIVHYMCQQSLLHYLETELGGKVNREELETFIKYADAILEHEKTALQKAQQIKNGEIKETKYEQKIPESIIKNADEIDKLLEDIKVCDPAVGSGAFPVGMLHEIVKLRQLLSVYLKRTITTYYLKRHCIENSLYGVDIDPGAVETCKLRFWLSMIVDEEDFTNIKPLPNLDYKVVCGNSLLGVVKNLFNNQDFEELENLKPKYFNETNPTKKQELKKRIDELISKITDGHKEFDFEVFFSEVFHQKRGFDVLIGNPPYIKEYTRKEAFDGLRESQYYKGKMDIWYFFVCKGIDLLKKKGILTFIAQNNWTTNLGASKMRKKVIEDAKIIQLIDFGPYFIFENADTQTMIMMFQKDNLTDNYKIDYRRIISDINDSNVVNKVLKKQANTDCEYLEPIINRNEAKDKILTFADAMKEKIISKIKYIGHLNLQKEEIIQGIVCPQDFLNKENAKKLNNKYPIGTGIFVISDDEKLKLELNDKEKELIKPYYTIEELKRYFGIKENKYWIIYTKSDINKKINDYSNIKRHLDKFSEIITSDYGPYGLHRARDEKFFKGEKIISLRKCKIPTFTYTDFDCYVSQTFFVIKTNRVSMKYLTGILNSKVIAFWLWHRGKKQGMNYQIDAEPLLNIPLPSITSSNDDIVKQIEALVDKILNAKKQDKNADTSKWEQEIDQLAYNLYELTEEEIAIVEERNRLIVK